MARLSSKQNQAAQQTAGAVRAGVGRPHGTPGQLLPASLLQPAAPKPARRPLRVILVDTGLNPDMALRAMIEKEGAGWVLDAVRGAKDALRRFAAAVPDVVVADLKGLDPAGLECVRQLKSKMPGLPILVITEKCDPGQIILSLKAGACGYLIKPVGARQLAYAVESAARGLQLLSPDAVRALLDLVLRSAPQAVLAALTLREQEVFWHLAQNRQNKEIADHFGIGRGTVHTLLARIYSKLDVHDRESAVQKVFLPG